MLHEISIKRIEPIHGLTLRFRAINHLHYGRICAEIRVAAREKAVRANGYPIQITYEDIYREDDVDTEFVLPVEDSWTENVSLATFGTMTVREVSGIEAASYIPRGSLDHFNDGMDEFRHWAASNGYQPGGSIRMVYVRGFVVPLPVEEWMFEVQHVLERV